MRFASTHFAIVGGFLLGGIGLISPVTAQQVRSADQITRDLMPTASMLSGPTRGIRPVSPNVAGSLPSVTIPAAIPMAVAGAAGAPAATASIHAATVMPHAVVAPASNLLVQFQSGSAEFTPQAIRALDELGKALSSPSLMSYRFRIEGHTDTVGSPATNMSLSEHRAAAVAQYLSSKFGIAAARMEAVGMGAEHPAVKTAEQTPEPRNRRVQVINLGA